MSIADLLKLLKNPTVIALILIISLGLFALWQNSRIDHLGTQLRTAQDAAQAAEEKRLHLETQIAELNARHAEIASKNRKIDAELYAARVSIDTWKSMYEEAIKNPTVDERIVNDYAQRMFLDLSCATGQRQACDGASGTSNAR